MPCFPIRRKFEEYQDCGQITKSDFRQIVCELQLGLDDELWQSYVEMNFRYADRQLRGRITVGQFLACYATLLSSHHHAQRCGGAASLTPAGSGAVATQPPTLTLRSPRWLFA